jgi:alpha-amylase/alpha-mannosidase (GH57 family)
MERYVCIHGHFYQPPRENPWLEAIELQDSAYPYHDWNERVAAECYGTNATSRILDERGRIMHIVNNYASISFDFGPTLLAWLEFKAPDVYSAILDADEESRKRFSGHGAAIAQAYNHMILPLANRRDKRTQVIWGIRDFERRFGRKPEGMWLPETAIDIETLEVLADQDIAFTILAPHQAKRVRPLRQGRGIAPHQAAKGIPQQDTKWRDVSGARVDPTMAYLCRLPSRKTIALFFYDGPISRSVAFEGLLNQGERFGQRLMNGFSDARDRAQLVHIATDGESYGHHHRKGDMALAYALHWLQTRELARLSVYGEYLEKHPPTHEAEIFENTSWSCAHGIERWQSDCGCNTGGYPQWNQSWRAPLREALDWLRDRLTAYFEIEAAPYLHDPWAARNDYISVLLDRSPRNLDRFFDIHASRALQEDERRTVLKLMELQRHAMLMYTSCGWFFDELSGIETVQVIQYAGRALQLAQELSDDPLEKTFLQLLSHARSNIPEHKNARLIYEQFVRPAAINLEKVGAHYAISSLFEEYTDRTKVYCYTVERKRYAIFATGNAKFAAGSANIISDITGESESTCFGVIHLGDHNLNCGVRKYGGDRAFDSMSEEILNAFNRADFLNAIRLLDRNFDASTYSLKSLFRDEQRKILNLILQSALGEAEDTYRQVYNRYAPMMRFLKDSGVPLPAALFSAAQVVLNSSIRSAFEDEDLDSDHVRNLLREAELVAVPLQTDSLEYALRKNLEETLKRLLAPAADMTLVRKLRINLELLQHLPFEVNLWKIQNLFNRILREVFPALRQQAGRQNTEAQQWIKEFYRIADLLFVIIT